MSFSLKSAVALQAVALAAAQTYSNSDGVYTITQELGEDVPLASKSFDYPNLPYQADTGDGPRGRMQGYNICNSTTVGEDSMCQTGFVNSIEDFCIWGAPGTSEVVADVEGEMVAYCTTSKHGTRVLPEGSLQGVQFMTTPGYVQVIGNIDQTALGLEADDYGGEEDPHGADRRGNPLGSLLYSSAFGDGAMSKYKQVHEWSYFVGSGTFCFKACDPEGPDAARLCEHIYDRIGCTYNAPADYGSINGTFEACQGDNQLPVGVYVSGGETMTWNQPPESLGPISDIPYEPSTPASSECTPYTSSKIYTDMGEVEAASASMSGSMEMSGSMTMSGKASAATQSGSGSSDDEEDGGSDAQKGAANSDDEDSSAVQVVASSMALIVAAGMAFFA